MRTAYKCAATRYRLDPAASVTFTLQRTLSGGAPAGDARRPPVPHRTPRHCSSGFHGRSPVGILTTTVARLASSFSGFGASGASRSSLEAHVFIERIENDRTHLEAHGAFIYHLSEGTDPKLVDEYTKVHDEGLLPPGFCAIHCTALERPNYDEWETPPRRVR